LKTVHITTKNVISIILLIISLAIITTSIKLNNKDKYISNYELPYEKLDSIVLCISRNIIAPNIESKNYDYLALFFLNYYICPPQVVEVYEYTSILSDTRDVAFKPIGIILEREEHRIRIVNNLLSLPLDSYHCDTVFDCVERHKLSSFLTGRMLIIDLKKFELDYIHNIGTVMPTSYSYKKELITLLYAAEQ